MKNRTGLTIFLTLLGLGLILGTTTGLHTLLTQNHSHVTLYSEERGGVIQRRMSQQDREAQTIGIVLIFVTATGGLTFICLVMYMVNRTTRKESDALSEEEMKLLQDLWSGLQKMELRVGNLEEILSDRAGRPGRSYESLRQ